VFGSESGSGVWVGFFFSSFIYYKFIYSFCLFIYILDFDSNLNHIINLFFDIIYNSINPLIYFIIHIINLRFIFHNN